MKELFLLVIYSVLNLTISAQNIDLGSWNIVNIKYNFNSKISTFTEAQLRSLKFYSNFHYYEFKGGLNYKLNSSLVFTTGFGTYQTYKEGGNFVLPKNNDEFRIWPQILLVQNIGIFKIEQRYRAELRFTSNGYRNRFRYRLGVSYPFGKKKNDFHPFQLSASNELFFTNNEPYFERNRIQFGINFKPSTTTSIQLGYLHQFDYQINDETGKDFLQIGFLIELGKKE